MVGVESLLRFAADFSMCGSPLEQLVAGSSAAAAVVGLGFLGGFLGFFEGLKRGKLWSTKISSCSILFGWMESLSFFQFYQRNFPGN